MRVVRVHQPPTEGLYAAVKTTFCKRTIRDCGVAEFAPGVYAHGGERHVHDHDEVFIILSGEITVPIMDGLSDVARAGDWVLVKAGEEHHLTNHTALPCVAMFLILE